MAQATLQGKEDPYSQDREDTLKLDRLRGIVAELGDRIVVIMRNIYHLNAIKEDLDRFNTLPLKLRNNAWENAARLAVAIRSIENVKTTAELKALLAEDENLRNILSDKEIKKELSLDIDEKELTVLSEIRRILDDKSLSEEKKYELLIQHLGKIEAEIRSYNDAKVLAALQKIKETHTLSSAKEILRLEQLLALLANIGKLIKENSDTPIVSNFLAMLNHFINGENGIWSVYQDRGTTEKILTNPRVKELRNYDSEVKLFMSWLERVTKGEEEKTWEDFFKFYKELKEELKQLQDVIGNREFTNHLINFKEKVKESPELWKAELNKLINILRSRVYQIRRVEEAINDIRIIVEARIIAIRKELKPELEGLDKIVIAREKAISGFLDEFKRTARKRIAKQLKSERAKLEKIRLRLERKAWDVTLEAHTRFIAPVRNVMQELDLSQQTNRIISNFNRLRREGGVVERVASRLPAENRPLEQVFTDLNFLIANSDRLAAIEEDNRITVTTTSEMLKGRLPDVEKCKKDFEDVNSLVMSVIVESETMFSDDYNKERRWKSATLFKKLKQEGVEQNAALQ